MIDDLDGNSPLFPVNRYFHNGVGMSQKPQLSSGAGRLFAGTPRQIAC